MKTLSFAAFLLLLAVLPASAQWATSHSGQSIACDEGSAAGFPCEGVELLSIVSMGTLRAGYINDMWGWTDPDTGIEYALVGRTDGVTFIDLSTPTTPKYVGELPMTPGSVATTWRDLKVYQNHVFVVSDNSRSQGVQVFDLTRLRGVTTPQSFTADVVYDQLGEGHNIAINEETGFAYVGGSDTCGGALHMIDIRTPLTPTFAGCFGDTRTGRAGTGYVHDAQCVVYQGPDTNYQGREICFGANETAIAIADVEDKANVVALGVASYPNVNYAHQGWLTEDHRYFIMGDELDESGGPTRSFVWDVQDLEDPQLLKIYEAPTAAIDHNMYIRGSYVFQANYASGLRILDISDVANPSEIAYFDTYPPHDDPTFAGAWTVYPFFDSGIVLVTSTREGLFVLAPDVMQTIVSTQHAASVPQAFTLGEPYPNPFTGLAEVTLEVPQPQALTVAVYDVLGREVARLHDGILPAGPHRLTLDGEVLVPGLYVVRASGPAAVQTQTLVRLR